MRWPEGPPHLALNPPYLFIFFFFFCVLLFLSFLCFLIHKSLFFFSPRKGHVLFIFECLPLFLLSLFWPPPYSISLSLSLSLLFLSFFLSSCVSFFAFFWFLFLSLSFLFFLLCFCFMKGTTSKYSIAIFSSSMFSLFLVSCLAFLSNPFFLSLRFPDLSYVFCSTSINVFSFKTNNLKKKDRNVWSKGGLQQNGLFMNLCFAKCQKLSFFGHFLAIFG